MAPVILLQTSDSYGGVLFPSRLPCRYSEREIWGYLTYVMSSAVCVIRRKVVEIKTSRKRTGRGEVAQDWTWTEVKGTIQPKMCSVMSFSHYLLTYMLMESLQNISLS